MNKIILYQPQPSKFPLYNYTPLSLLRAVSILAKEKYSILIKSYFEKDKEKFFLKEAKEAICFGLSAISGYQIYDGLKMAKLIRKNFPDLPIVWGGWHSTILPEQTIKNKYVDIIIRGEGEKTFYELVKALKEKTPLENVLGITFKKNGQIISTPNRQIALFDNLPETPYYLLKNIEDYVFNSEFGSRSLNYTSSYGCPFACNFCVQPVVFKGNWTGLCPERVVDEIKKLVENYKINGIVINDDNFFADLQRVKEIARLIVKSGLKINWGGADARVGHILKLDKETMELLKKSGLKNVLIGVESGSDYYLKVLKKGFEIKDFLEAIKKLKKYDIYGCYSFMIGIPCPRLKEEDPKKVIKEELNSFLNLVWKIHKINPKHFILFYIFNPLPRTPLFEEAKKLGYEEPVSLEEWAKISFRNKNIPWLPKKYAKFPKMFKFYLPLLGGYIRDKIKNRKNPIEKFFLLMSETILRNLAYFRFKFKFFHFPIEYWIMTTVYKFYRLD